MDLIELDSFRAAKMRELLNEEGQKQIWLYDVCSASVAYREAIDQENYDGIEAGAKAKGEGKSFALIGADIEDHYFSSKDELEGLIKWLCLKGYLSCYSKIGDKVKAFLETYGFKTATWDHCLTCSGRNIDSDEGLEENVWRALEKEIKEVAGEYSGDDPIQFVLDK